tara:strand:- start:619 stop:798 length:180 start_codon:yes stop_codon:yes gene_type:complete
MNDYIYTERTGIPCIEYTGKHHARITKELTSEEFDLFVEFKTVQHNQAQEFLMKMTKEL